MSSFSNQWKWLSWVLVGIVVVAALVYGTLDERHEPTAAERVSEVARTIRCPQCRGQSVAESNVAVAREIRADIRVRIGEGQTNAEIQQAYVNQYGDESILLTPAGTGFTTLVWVVPVVAAVAALAALAFAFQRWRGELAAIDRATDADHELVAAARQRSDES